MLQDPTHPAASKARNSVEPVCVLFRSLFDLLLFLYIKGGLSGAGLEVGLGGGAGSLEGAGFSGGAGGSYGGSSSYESSFASSSGGGVGGGAGFDLTSAAFSSADTNQDGGLSAAEFGKFVQGGL